MRHSRLGFSNVAAFVRKWMGGEAGNTADNSTGFGAVGYNYRISKHEVTIGQYAEFLNAVGWVVK